MPNFVPQIPLAKDDRWMDSREIATLFGVDDETINRWRRQDRLPANRIGRRYWYKKSNVNKLLESMELPTI